MGPLISTDDLRSRLLGSDPPALLDVRWKLGGPPGRAEYERGHLPGAVFVDLEAELAGPPGAGGRHPLPSAAALERVFRRAGVFSDRSVVVYDADDGSSAARAWWLLRWLGHEQVAVLDGGYRAWWAEGLPVSTEEPSPAEGDLVARPGRMPVLDAGDAASLARTGLLLDARAPERYRGETEPVDPRAGHIPGAVNAPFAEHVSASGKWRSASELAERFGRLGAGRDEPVGAYCGSGVTACSVVLALEHAGVTRPDRPAALYPGSWSNWVSDPAREAATGERPG